MMIVDCPGCMAGDHTKHVEHWGKRPDGVLDDEFFGNMADIFSEDMLSPEAQELVEGLRSTDPAVRNAAVHRVNRLLDEDPLDTPTTGEADTREADRG